MKDALGHGSNRRGVHTRKISAIPKTLVVKGKWTVAHDAGINQHRTRIDAVNHYEDIRATPGRHYATVTDPHGNIIYSHGRGS